MKKTKLNKILKGIKKIADKLDYYQCELENDDDLTEKQFDCYSGHLLAMAKSMDLFEGHIDELRSANIDDITEILNSKEEKKIELNKNMKLYITKEQLEENESTNSTIDKPIKINKKATPNFYGDSADRLQSFSSWE